MAKEERARRLTALAIACTFALGAATASCWKGRPRPEPVRVSVQPFLAFAPLYVALDKGYFREEGLDVELVRLASQDALAALLGGKIDVLAGRATPGLFNAMGAGAPVKIVADKGYVPRPGVGCVYDTLLARSSLVAEGALSLTSALRGRRFAYSRTTVDELFLDRLLTAAGLSREDAILIDVEKSQTLQALRLSEADVVIVTEPWVTQARLAGIGAVWLQIGAFAPEQQTGVLAFGERLLVKDRAAGRNFVAAYLRAVRELNQPRSPELAGILARRTELPKEVIQEACWGNVRDSGEIDLASVQTFQEWAKSRGLLESILPPERYWDPEFVRAAPR